VNLTLNRDDRKSLVQCKQWKTVSVGAPVIREMFGLIRGCKSSSSSFSSSFSHPNVFSACQNFWFPSRPLFPIVS